MESSPQRFQVRTGASKANRATERSQALKYGGSNGMTEMAKREKVYL